MAEAKQREREIADRVLAELSPMPGVARVAGPGRSARQCQLVLRIRPAELMGLVGAVELEGAVSAGS